MVSWGLSLQSHFPSLRALVEVTGGDEVELLSENHTYVPTRQEAPPR